MDEYVMHDVRNDQNVPMMRFVIMLFYMLSAVLKRKMNYCNLCSE